MMSPRMDLDSASKAWRASRDLQARNVSDVAHRLSEANPDPDMLSQHVKDTVPSRGV